MARSEILIVMFSPLKFQSIYVCIKFALPSIIPFHSDLSLFLLKLNVNYHNYEFLSFQITKHSQNSFSHNTKPIITQVSTPLKTHLFRILSLPRFIFLPLSNAFLFRIILLTFKFLPLLCLVIARRSNLLPLLSKPILYLYPIMTIIM